MLSGTYVACMTIVLALCLVHENNRRWIKEWHKLSPQHTRTHARTHRLSVEPAKWLQNSFFVRFDEPWFDGTLKTAAPTIAKEILTCEKQSLTVSVYPLRFAIGPLEVTLKTCNSKGYVSANWNYCPADVFTARPTGCDWMNIGQYCPQTVQCIVQLFSITRRR